MTKYKKRIRLKSFDYKGLYGYFITLWSYNKMQVFLNRQAVEMCLSMIKEYSEKYKFWVWAYCFMPDHLHLLVEGNNEYSDFKKFISHGKRIGLRESRLIRLES